MRKNIEEKLEAWRIFYKDKARWVKDEKQKISYESYAAGIGRAIAEIKKFEETKNDSEIL